MAKDCILQTPYNSNKSVALTSSQLSEKKKGKRKMYLGNDLKPIYGPTQRQVNTNFR
jgi:hypothetical protein